MTNSTYQLIKTAILEEDIISLRKIFEKSQRHRSDNHIIQQLIYVVKTYFPNLYSGNRKEIFNLLFESYRIDSQVIFNFINNAEILEFLVRNLMEIKSKQEFMRNLIVMVISGGVSRGYGLTDEYSWKGFYTLCKIMKDSYEIEYDNIEITIDDEKLIPLIIKLKELGFKNRNFNDEIEFIKSKKSNSYNSLSEENKIVYKLKFV